MASRLLARPVDAPQRRASRYVGSLRSRLRTVRCVGCGSRLADDICKRCGSKRRLSAPEWIDLLADAGSFAPLDTELLDADPLGYADEVPYRERIREARLKTGVDESVVVGRARLSGRPIVLVVFDFRFFGGSVGVAAGERIVRAFLAAASERRQLVMVVTSSGARMQEGLASLFQMARTTAAVSVLRRSRTAFVAVLGDPTTGAPFASCANLADVVLAERGALIGFAGPRVVAALTGMASEGTRAEELLGSGAVDAVLPRGALRASLTELLPLLEPRGASSGSTEAVALPDPAPTADRWGLVEAIRQPTWPTGAHWLAELSDRSYGFHGDRVGSDDPALVCALAEISGRHVVVLAQDRTAGDGLIGPAGYRKALRVLRIAARLRLPVLSLVDTPGATVGPDADRGDIAYWVAECFIALLELPVPVVSLVVGQGSSGGALALSVGDRTYMLEQSMFSVMAPEGTAAILGRDPQALAEMCDKLKLSAADAFVLGLVDGVIPGHEDGRRARAAAVRQTRTLLLSELGRLAALDGEELVARRRQRYLELTRHLLLSDPPTPSLPAA